MKGQENNSHQQNKGGVGRQGRAVDRKSKEADGEKRREKSGIKDVPQIPDTALTSDIADLP